MKFLSASLLFLWLSFFGPEWLTDFNQATTEARNKHKLIVLNFSGSDWCIPCIRMHSDIFESKSFKKLAEENLVLVNADFPRLKKHTLSKEQVKKNEEIAEKYNPKGQFPLTLLINENGQVLKKWEGLPKESAADFTNEISAFLHGSK